MKLRIDDEALAIVERDLTTWRELHDRAISTTVTEDRDQLFEDAAALANIVCSTLATCLTGE